MCDTSEYGTDINKPTALIAGLPNGTIIDLGLRLAAASNTTFLY